MAVNISPWYSLDEWVSYWRSKKAEDVIWATDSDQNLVLTFRVLMLSTTIIVDRQGRIAYRDGGPTPYDTLRAEIEEIL